MPIESPCLLHISSLPSVAELQLWRNEGITRLLNVSGVDIIDIYPVEALVDFHISQLQFADVFTNGIPISSVEDDVLANSETYLQLSIPEHRLGFLKAVQTLLNQLRLQTNTSVFCHRGIGRSPLVVAAAFQHYYAEPTSHAIARTRTLHRPALFTDISLSALQWCSEQNLQ